MNKQHLMATRDALAARPEHFEQGRWAHPCGTPACIAAFAVVAAGYTLCRFTEQDTEQPPDKSEAGTLCQAPGEQETRDIAETAARLLGLTVAQEQIMFANENQPDADAALRMLDHAIVTDVVAWTPSCMQRERRPSAEGDEGETL